ncbi:MAG: hypothetical protein LBN22_03530 [Clostridiales Family XIII bacterium]|jgi:hypothetical protein|nr:hypothetical protein [Clostridiales Family XIII bacterium]
MVVEDYYIGNTHIKINDEFCRDLTAEQVERRLKRISNFAIPKIIKKEMPVIKKYGLADSKGNDAICNY